MAGVNLGTPISSRIFIDPLISTPTYKLLSTLGNDPKAAWNPRPKA